MKLIINNVSSVLLIFLVVLANAQRSSNGLRDVDFQELARQNKITKQILEAYLQKKLGLRNGPVKAPSISDILPVRTMNESRRKQEKVQENVDYQQEEEQPEQGQEGQEYAEDDSLQSVESEQIDSIYNEGRKKYPTPPFEPELEPTSYHRPTTFDRSRDPLPRGNRVNRSPGKCRRASCTSDARSPPPAPALSRSGSPAAPPVSAACAPAASAVPIAEPPTTTPDGTPATSHLLEEEAVVGVLDTATPDFVADILEILGADPTRTQKFGKDIQKDVAVRFEFTATTGLSKEDRKDLTTKYLVTENCKMIGAPALNPEVKSGLFDTVINRDSVIESKQKLMATAISSLGEAISLVITSKEKNTDLLRLLMDTGKTLCDCQHQKSNIRRNFITFAVKKDMKESLQNTKIDSLLFGQNLSETLKAAKAINKQGSELKQPTTSKPNSGKNNLSSTSKNWRGRSRAPPARSLPTTPKMSTGPPAPATHEPRAASYRPSQHRGGYSRR